MKRTMLAACGAALFATAFAGPALDARKPAAKAALPRVPLTIQTAGGARRFQVEVARSEAQQAQGLMFRTSVPAGTGMIFPMSPPREATFWMKNTLVPLDMIFVRADGTIARIAANTQPMSLDLVPSGEPVAAVLEIAGGAAARQGIREGDKVHWKG